MNAPHGHEALKAARAMRRRLYDLAESQRWVHHVGNLDSVLFGMYFRFAVPPVGLSVASISLAG